uniref:ABC transporter domain-containing protein n=1 Tax=Arcella intermedia TaxID=1963864 RepID=A0A6B2L4B2_9EUKA
MVWAQFGFTRGVFLMNYACSTSYACYSHVQLVPGDELLTCIISLFICGVVYFILYLYFDAVLPQEYGVPKHPLFFLKPLWDCCCKKQDINDAEHSFLIDSNLEEDDDVANIRSLVKKRKFSDEDPLVLDELRKVYADGKIAVKNFCLDVKKNTCFGLLGENGAGKTTTISMLTGMFPPTSGTALVGSYDITSEIEMVQLVIGLCPQFDILWDDLTCLEHMLFYSRIKGIDPNEEMDHAKQILREVGLYDARHRNAVNLSGGMRRRLSLAISLVGKSRITFLDEPTTGLDPASRRHIWTIIARGKRDRAIILTTHSMDEAETLCNNIGIMAHGALRCIGSAQHLKSRFGEGYLLTLSYQIENKKSATKFIKSQFQGAVRTARFRGTDQYKIPNCKVSQVFLIMENEYEKVGIKDWSISQMGLESIFQRIVKETNEKENKVEEQ